MTEPALTLDGFHCEFATLAERLADDRARGYPAMIEAGELTRADAAHRLFVMRGIAEIWRCAADNLMPNRKLASVRRDDCLEQLAEAIQGAEKRQLRRPNDATIALLVEQLRAMRWWHAQYPGAAHGLNMTFMLRHDALRRAIDGAPDQAAA